MALTPSPKSNLYNATGPEDIVLGPFLWRKGWACGKIRASQASCLGIGEIEMADDRAIELIQTSLERSSEEIAV